MDAPGEGLGRDGGFSKKYEEEIRSLFAKVDFDECAFNANIGTMYTSDKGEARMDAERPVTDEVGRQFAKIRIQQNGTSERSPTHASALIQIGHKFGRCHIKTAI